MNQQQRKYVLKRLEDECGRKKAQIKRHVEGPYWPGMSDLLLKLVVDDVTNYLQDKFPEMYFRLSGFNAFPNDSYHTANIRFECGPTSKEKHEMAYPDISAKVSEIDNAARIIADQIMLGGL